MQRRMETTDVAIAIDAIKAKAAIDAKAAISETIILTLVDKMEISAAQQRENQRTTRSDR